MAGRFSSFGQGLQNRPKHRQTDPFWMSLAQNRAVGLLQAPTEVAGQALQPMPRKGPLKQAWRTQDFKNA